MTSAFLEAQVIDQLLDNSPTSATSNWYDVGDFDKVTFCFVADVTAVGLAPQVTYTVQVLVGPTGIDSTGQPTGGTAKTYDKLIKAAGEDSPSSSAVMTTDSTVFVSIAPEDPVKWVRVVATGANTDADDTVDCDAFLLAKTAS